MAITPQQLLYIIYGLYHLLFWPWMIMFVLRRHMEPIRSRGWQLAVLQSFGALISNTLAMLGTYSCFPRHLNYIISIPIGSFPYLFRAYLIWYNDLFQRGILQQESNLTDSSSDRSSDLGSARSKRKFYSFMGRLKWYASMKLQIGVYIGLFIFHVIVAIIIYFTDDWKYPDSVLDPVAFPNHNRCFKKSDVALTISQFAIAVIFVIFWGVILLRISEAFLMRWELLAILTIGSGLFVPWLTDFFYPLPDMITKEFWCIIIHTCFAQVTLGLPVIASYRYERYIKQEIRHLPLSGTSHDIVELRLDSSVDDFFLIFTEPVLEKSFEEFTMQSWCVENLVFYRAVKKFKLLPKEQLAHEAKKIWKVFFLRETFEINVDAAVREKIMEDINSDNIEAGLFLGAEKAVLGMLRYSIFPLWKQSSLCSQALKELGSESFDALRAKKNGS